MAEAINELSMEERMRQTAKFLDQQAQALGEGINDLVEPTVGLVIDGRSIDRAHPVIARAQVSFAINLLQAVRMGNQEELMGIYKSITASVSRIATMRGMEYVQRKREDI